MLKVFRKKVMNEITISLKIDKHEALDVNVLANAFISLDSLLREYLQSSINANVALSLKNVEKGSDIFNFMVNITTHLFSAQNIEYIKNLFELFNNLRKIKEKSVEEIEKETHYTQKFLKDSNNIINMGNYCNTTIYSNVFNSTISITKDNVESFKNGINTIEKIKDYKEPHIVKQIYENMIIEFYQTTNETKKDIKYKAFCYNICNKAISTIIDSVDFKEIVLENPYNYKFLCDVEIYVNANNEISTYRIFNFAVA